MEYRFQDWLSCPECEEQCDVSTLAHRTDIVFECYSCGTISEFAIGEDVPIQGLDASAVDEERADDCG